MAAEMEKARDRLIEVLRLGTWKTLIHLVPFQSDLVGEGGGQVAIIEGLPGAPQSGARRDGAKAGFETEPSVHLVSVQPADWDRRKAYDVTAGLLQSHPDLKGIMCANDVMALAALEAIDSAGKTGQVLVGGIDLIGQAKDAIARGRLACSVAFSPFVIGELVTRTAIAASMGRKIPHNLRVISVLATKDNIHLPAHRAFGLCR
jgi:ribose transport system substrate-binding protein